MVPGGVSRFMEHQRTMARLANGQILQRAEQQRMSLLGITKDNLASLSMVFLFGIASTGASAAEAVVIATCATDANYKVATLWKLLQFFDIA